MHYLIVFRARSETMKFHCLLSSYHVKSEIVNTPRQISVACGISVKVLNDDVATAREILSRRKFSTFAGIFACQGNFQRI